MSNQNLRLIPDMCPSLTEDVYKKLKEENINNSIDLLCRDPEELAAKTRISYKVIQNICKVLSAYQGAFQISGLELYNEAMKSCHIFSSGYKELDKILEGGLFSEEVIELFGSSGCGKTSLCLKMSCHIAVVEKRKVIYIDPMHSVNAAFIKSILSSYSSLVEELEEALSNIHMIYPKSVWDVCCVFEEFLKESYSHPFLSESKGGFVILDSLPILIKSLCGGSPFESYGILNHLGSLLHRFVKKRKACLIVVNNSVKKTENNAGSSFPPRSSESAFENSSSNAYKPDLGRYWMHFPHTRLLLEKKMKENKESNGNSDVWLLTVFKSTRLKRNSCIIDLFHNQERKIS